MLMFLLDMVLKVCSVLVGRRQSYSTLQHPMEPASLKAAQLKGH